MQKTSNVIPSPQALLKAWQPFNRLVGVTVVRNKKDLKQAGATVNALLDEIGGDETHPLAGVLDYLAEQIKNYESKHAKLPEAEPREVLRYLMQERNLKQEDLSDCAPQGRISEILNGKRGISKELAKRFASTFNVPVQVFL